MPQRAGLRHKQRAQLRIIETRNLGAPALGQFPPALGAAQRKHGNPGRAQRLHIAMRGALRSFQAFGQLAGGETSVRLQQQQGGEQPVRLHRACLLLIFSLFSIYDSPCHICLFTFDGEEKTDGIEGVFPMAVGARGRNLAQGDRACP